MTPQAVACPVKTPPTMLRNITRTGFRSAKSTGYQNCKATESLTFKRFIMPNTIPTKPALGPSQKVAHFERDGMYLYPALYP